METISAFYFTDKLRIQDNSPPRFPPWESGMKRRRACQVQSSLIPCMLRRLNRAEAAGPSACESAGFPEGRQWHPVLRLGALLTDRFVFIKSCALPKLDFLSPMWAPRLRSGTPCFKVWAFTASSVAFWRFTGCWLATSAGGGGGFLWECIIRAEGAGSPWKTAS